MDLECAGNNIPIPGQEGFKTINGAFSNYWRNALMSDLNQEVIDFDLRIFLIQDSGLIQVRHQGIAPIIRKCSVDCFKS